MRAAPGTAASQDWEGAETPLRLAGGRRSLSAIVLRRRVTGALAVVDPGDPAPLRRAFAALTDDVMVYEDAVLITSLPEAILTRAPGYRDRAEAANPVDELKNHGGWGGFTTRDRKRCRLMAHITALTDPWWSRFVRLAQPHQHSAAITRRPLLLNAPARLTRPGGQTRLTMSHPHAEVAWVETVCREIVAIVKTLRQTAEHLNPQQGGCRSRSRAWVKYLRGRELQPPERLPAPT